MDLYAGRIAVIEPAGDIEVFPIVYESARDACGQAPLEAAGKDCLFLGHARFRGAPAQWTLRA